MKSLNLNGFHLDLSDRREPDLYGHATRDEMMPPVWVSLPASAERVICWV